MRNRSTVSALIVFFTLLTVSFMVWGAGVGQPARLIPYVGQIQLDNVDVNGDLSVVFRLYDDVNPASSTLAAWEETWPALTVSAGRFAVMLGSNTPIPAAAFERAELYVEVEVEGNVLGRQRIYAVPEAQRAAGAYNFTVSNNLVTRALLVEEDLTVDGDANVSQDLSVAGAATITGAAAITGTATITGTARVNTIQARTGSTVSVAGATINAGAMSAASLITSGGVDVNGTTYNGWERKVCSSIASGAECSCSAGRVLLGGGALCSGSNNHVNTSSALDDDTWHAWCEDSSGNNLTVTVTIFCARFAS